MHIVNVMYVLYDEFAKLKPSSVKRTFGLVWLNGLHVLHDISIFEHYESQINGCGGKRMFLT